MAFLNQRAYGRASQPTTTPVPLGAPLGGWNTRDPIEGMEQTDAITLDNWFPEVSGIATRTGSAPYYDLTVSAPVYSLMPFQAGASAKLLAATSGAIYDISTENTPLTPLKSGFASDKWQSTNINAKMIMMNGVDVPQSYDGTAITAAGFTGAGLTPSNLVDCGTFHNRLFAWKVAEAGFWFGGVNAVTGALTFFDLASVAPDGGNVVTIEPFSYDGGQGISSFTLILLDSGELLFYQGTDPTNTANWSLMGRYVVGIPLSRRATARQGGDLYWPTNEDYQKLSVYIAALAQGTIPPLTKASGAINAAALSGSSLFGWDAIYYPRGRKLIFNVPETDGTFSQHVLNTTTNAWCRFKGMNALCWVIYKGKPYFGAANGMVYQADIGASDILSETLSPWDTSPWDVSPWATPNYTAIAAKGQQAWTILEQGNVQFKRMAMARPILSTMGKVSFEFGIGLDYVDPSVATATVAASVTSPWDISPWDITPWGGTRQADNDWHVTSGVGTALSVVVNVNTIRAISWIRTDLRYEQGVAL